MKEYNKENIIGNELEAVKQNGLAVQYIDNPSEEVQLEAVKQNGGAIKYIAKPSIKLRIISWLH